MPKHKDESAAADKDIHELNLSQINF